MQRDPTDLNGPEIALGLITAAVAFFAPPLALLPGCLFVYVVFTGHNHQQLLTLAARVPPALASAKQFVSARLGRGKAAAAAGEGAAPGLPAAAAPSEAADAPPPLLPALASAQRLLIVGSSDAGKTTLLQHVLSQRGKALAIDPHGFPGKWGTARVVGSGRNYAAIGTVLTWLVETMGTRYQQIARGEVAEGAHPKMTILVDEWRAITKNVPTAGAALGALLTEARKANMDLVVGTHSDRVKALGIEGEGDLRDGFAVVRLRNAGGVRSATLDTEHGRTPYALPGPYTAPPVPPAPPSDPRPALAALLGVQTAPPTDLPAGMPRVGLSAGMAGGIADIDAESAHAPPAPGGIGDLAAPRRPVRFRPRPRAASPRQAPRRFGSARRAAADLEAPAAAPLDTPPAALSEDDRIRRMLRVPMGANEIHRALRGDRTRVLDRVRALKIELGIP